MSVSSILGRVPSVRALKRQMNNLLSESPLIDFLFSAPFFCEQVGHLSISAAPDRLPPNTYVSCLDQWSFHTFCR